MPPRYVYWTIIVDGQPTAFRSGSLEDIMPTFNRLKEKQPSAELKWFQNGQLWPSRHDAQDFMRARGERGRAKDPRQSKGDDTDVASGFPVRRSLGEGGSRTEKPERAWNAKPEWKTRSTFSAKSDKPSTSAKATADRQAPGRESGERPAWVPKGPAPKKDVASGFSRSSPSGGKPEWKPKGTFKPKEEGHRPSTYAKATGGKSARDQARSSFRPKSYTPSFAKASEGRPNAGAGRTRSAKARDQKLEWNPKAESRPGGPNAGFAKSDPDGPKRKWVPKAEYKKSLGIEAKRDDKWRPGGEHKDPKQKYKDAKKAKWTKFKANIRARSTKPRKPKDE